MRKVQIQILLVFLLFFAGFSAVIFALVKPNGSADQELFELKRSKATAAKFKKRQKQISEEVATLKDGHWAGSYHYGGGLGVDVSLDLAPKAGFVFEWRGCMGVYDRNYGTIQEKDGVIHLSCKFKNNQEGFQGTATNLLPIKWGERRYLIATDQIIDFCNAINLGTEPSRDFSPNFLLNRDDAAKRVEGFPPVPEKYRPYLLKQPIDAKIIEIGKSSLRPSCVDWNFRDTVIVLDVGKEDGVLPGMEFYVYDPDGKFASAEVKKINENSCEAVMTQIGEDAPPPEVGWKLSTASKWAQERSKECYVIISDGKTSRTLTLPITGNETILDAIGCVQGLSSLSSKDIWIARSNPAGKGDSQILPVDWDLIASGDLSTTNPRLLSGDRVYIVENPTKAFLGYLKRLVHPPPKLTPGINPSIFSDSKIQLIGYRNELE